MTNLDQATKILENIQSEIDEVKKLLLPEENKAPEAAPAPSFEAEPKAEGGITSRLLNTFNTIKENVEAVIPTKAPAPAPVPEVEAAPVPEVEAAPVPEVEAAPTFEAPSPVAAPIATEAEANTAGSSASEDALNAILGASAELPSQAQEQAPAPAEPTPAPTEGEQPAE